MTMFWQNSDFVTQLLLFISFGLSASWIAWKLRGGRYLLTPYTVPVLIYAWTAIVVGPLQYDPQAWLVLNRNFAGGTTSELNASMRINLFGYCIFLIVMWLVEAHSSHGARSLSAPIVRRLSGLTFERLRALQIFALLLFVSCLTVARQIPLLGARTIFSTELTALRPVYNFANFIILFTTSVLIVYRFVGTKERRGGLLILAGITAMLLTGGRTSVLSGVELLLLLVLYRRFATRRALATGMLVGASLVLGLVGLALAAVRVGGGVQLSTTIQSAAYGNTFSDLRDGAFVLAGWSATYGGHFLFGKTYLAGAMSFIPSSSSDFRTEYSWGYFNTQTLFGYTGHYGFRGGWSLEAFLNFGWIGVVALAIANGYLLGRLEATFRTYVGQQRSDYAPVYAAGWLAFTLHSILIASSATYDLFSLIGAFGLIALAATPSKATDELRSDGAGEVEAKRVADGGLVASSSGSVSELRKT